MPAKLILKNIPDAIYNRLREAADAHHRSMNSEVIACLEKSLPPIRISVEERLNRARQLRAGPQANFDAADISVAINEGRV